MYTQLKKGLSFAFAIAMAIMVSGNAYATEKTDKENKKEKARAATTYFYNGPSSSLNDHVANPSNWNQNQQPGLSCDNPTQIPCSLEVPEDMTLNEYLEELGSPQAIIDESAKGRN